MIDPLLRRLPAQPISWTDVARLCRRICLWRETEQSDAADALQRGELADALRAIRATFASDAALEEKLAATFAAETERVANAAVLAELLAPLLHEKLPARDPLSANAPATIEATTSLAPISPTPPPPRGDPGDIAHFIDEMIAQERSATPRSPTRRAS